MTGQDVFALVGGLALLGVMILGFWRSTSIPPRNDARELGHVPPPEGY